MNCVPSVYAHSKWKHNEGDISFWFDKWMGEDAIASSFPVFVPRLKLKECWLDIGWDLDLLCHLVGHQKANDIVSSLGGRKEGADKLF